MSTPDYEELDLNTYAPDAIECVNGHRFLSDADGILPEGWDHFFCRKCVAEFTGATS